MTLENVEYLRINGIINDVQEPVHGFGDFIALIPDLSHYT